MMEESIPQDRPRVNLPSVTQVLAPWANFGAVPPEVLARAAERGTKTHAACLAETAGLWWPPDPEVAPYVASFLSWLPNVEIIKAEFELRDDALKFIGHPDLLVRFRGDKFLAVIDLKTPVAYSVLWRPQVAAYRHLAEINGFPVRRTGSLRLKKDGGPPIFRETTDTYPQDLGGFLAALEAWKYFNALKGRMIRNVLWRP